MTYAKWGSPQRGVKEIAVSLRSSWHVLLMRDSWNQGIDVAPKVVTTRDEQHPQPPKR